MDHIETHNDGFFTHELVQDLRMAKGTTKSG